MSNRLKNLMRSLRTTKRTRIQNLSWLTKKSDKRRREKGCRERSNCRMRKWRRSDLSSLI